MQFYIIDTDPWRNSKILPDYCLKRVNIREGWQILSDCGHALDLSWTGQNKEYSRYHPNIWRYWKNSKSFYNFVDHYIACLSEYKDRYGDDKTYNTYREKLKCFVSEALSLARVPDLSEEEHIILYLSKRKSKHLTSTDYARICNG